MAQLPMIMVPKGINYHGRRVFIEVLPTDNPALLSEQVARDFKELIIAMKNQTVRTIDVNQAKIIQPN